MWRGKGPRCHPQTQAATPATTGPILGFIEAMHGTGTGATRQQFVLAGGRVLRRVDDSATGYVVSRQATQATFVHESAASFYPSGTGPGTEQESLYVAGRTSDTDALGELWQYDGANWTLAPVPARFLLRLGDRLIRGWGNQVSWTALAPMTAGNWTGAVSVGDRVDLITGLAAVAGVLVIFCRTGRVFTLNSDGSANDLFPGLVHPVQQEMLSAPGGQATSWVDAIYFRSADAFYRLQMGNPITITDIGPGRLVDNASYTAGPVQCFAGHQTWYGFQGVYNPAVGDSYLLQYGDWWPQGQGQDPGYTFAEVLHGNLVHWKQKRITSLAQTDLRGPNPRIYAGFADGSIEWFNLPKVGPNPFEAAAQLAPADFTDQPSYTLWPLHTLLAPADLKESQAVSLHGPRLTPGDRVEVSYWLDPTLRTLAAVGAPRASVTEVSEGWGQTNGAPRGTATALVPLDLPLDARGLELRAVPISGVETRLAYPFTSPGAMVEFPANTFAYGILLKESYVTDTTGTGEVLGTPIVGALVLRERLHPKLRLEFSFLTLAGNRLARRDGTPERRNADQLRAHVMAAARDPITTILELPDETVSGFSFIGYTETLPEEAKRYGAEWGLQVSLLQFRTATTFGSINRLQDLAIDGLGARSIDDLARL